MVRCPNCGQETSGGDCQWCKYPILKSRQVEAKRAKEAEKQARKQAVIAAREKAEQEAVEQASKEAARVLLSQIDSEQTKHIEECLKELESTHEELRIGKIGTEEALQRLRDISERIQK